MKLRKLRSLFALVAAGLAALVLIQPQSAAAVDTTVSTLKTSVLRLQLGANDRFVWDKPTGTDPTESLTVSSGCKLSPPSTLATLTAGTTSGGGQPPFVGFFDNALGVGTKSEGGGQPCGRVDAGQTLTFQLGSSLSGAAIDYAEIDIEGKFGVTVQADLYLVRPGATPQHVATEEYVTGGPDSGPDSSDSDNFRWRLPHTGKALFNKIVFKAQDGSTGAFSLEGGADGTDFCEADDSPDCDPLNEDAIGSLGAALETEDSLFHLVQFDGFIDCPSGPGDDDAEEAPGDATEPRVQFFRLENITGACTPIPYDLESSLGQVDILKDLLGQNAQFRVVVTWPATEETYALGESTIDYGNGPIPLAWCLEDGANGEPDGFPDLPPLPEPSVGNHAYCLESQTAVNDTTPDSEEETSAQRVTVTETLYGQLDPSIRR